MKGFEILLLLLQFFSYVTSSSEIETTCTQNGNAEGQCINEESPDPCGLWMSLSTRGRQFLGVFLGVNVQKGESVLANGGEMHVPIFDYNDNELSALHDVLWARDIAIDTTLLSEFLSGSFLSGLGNIAVCDHRDANINLQPIEEIDSIGVNRTLDPQAGSFSYRQHSGFVASQDLRAGQELFMNCDRLPAASQKPRSFEQDMTKIRENGVCIDNNKVGPSTIPKAGRGAFVKRHVKKGDAIISSPVVLFDRSDLYIAHQEYDEERDEIKYLEDLRGRQLLLNYCFGHPESDVLLLPVGPSVNYINHNNEPNAIMKFSTSSIFFDPDDLNVSSYELFDEDSTFVVDYIALKDLKPGDEIFLDYGSRWNNAFESHLEEWHASQNDEDYISATQYRHLHSKEPIRTLIQQKNDPYPNNIMTVCNFSEDDEDESDDEEKASDFSEWTTNNEGCVRPCRIMERTLSKDGSFVYTAHMLEANLGNVFTDEECFLSTSPKVVTKVPESAIMLIDKPYTTDELLDHRFRHEIGVPDGLFPELWMKENKEDMGDFILPNLAPLQMENVRWSSSGDVVAKNAYLIGLDPHLRNVLLNYCDKMGITESFRDITYRGNSLDVESDAPVEFGGLDWLIQRPPPIWNSNMHWISPRDEKTQEDYLRVLSAGGFDAVLQKIGEFFKFEGLVAYHLSFLGVSYCSDGYHHKDIGETGGKAFNLLIPLILVDGTEPEFELVQDGSDYDEDGDIAAGRLRYQYDTGVMVGDWAFHATSATNYRSQRQMRLAASVYIADVNEDNIKSIMSEYTQQYPPRDKPEVLLNMAGTHWKKDDPNMKLPKPALL